MWAYKSDNLNWQTKADMEAVVLVKKWKNDPVSSISQEYLESWKKKW